MSDKINEIPDFQSMAETLVRDARIYAEGKGLEFIDENFEKQGFTDGAFEAWPQRKYNFGAVRALLMKSSYLRTSIEVVSSNNKRIVFGSDAAYAAIHNEGGVIQMTVTAKMKRFFWAMYYRTKEETFKWAALKKVGTIHKIKIPKRQFMGDSATFRATLDAWVVNQIITRFKHDL